jgi:cell division protein FtsZ
MKRSSMREGPLTELFRSTEAVGPESAEEPGFEPFLDTGRTGSYVAVIRVVGIGGAGCNAVDRMIQAGLRGVEFVAVNADRQALEASDADIRIPVGLELTQGRGTGGDMAKGAAAVRESEEQLRQALRGSDLVFIAAGEGGGTGTGGAPVVAKISRELGALTVAVVTRPFGFEGARRMRAAEAGIEALRHSADTVIVIPNDRLMSVLDRGTSIVDAFKIGDDLLRQGVQGICDLITLPGLINLDFADVRTIIRDAGDALLGIGYATGENRAMNAAIAAIESPLLETPIDGARGLLLGITGGPDLSLKEVSEAAEVVQDAADPEANIIFGATVDPDLEGQVWVTVVAADFTGKRAAPPRAQDSEERAPLRPMPGRASRDEGEAQATTAIPQYDVGEAAEPPEAPDLSAAGDLPHPTAATRGPGDDDSDDPPPEAA